MRKIPKELDHLTIGRGMTTADASQSQMDAEFDALFCCQVCGARIPDGRIEALPGVTTCVEHSDAVGYTEDVAGVVDAADTRDLLSSMQSTTRADRS